MRLFFGDREIVRGNVDNATVSRMEKQISIIKTTRFRELRVSIGEFKGHDMVGLRQWVAPYRGSDEERIPTTNGVSFNVRDLPAVIAALREAEHEARADGLLSEAGEPA